MLDRLKKYLQEGIEQVLVDNIAAVFVGIVVTVIAQYNIPWFSSDDVSIKTKVLITTLIIAVLYLVCMLYNIRPNRYTFHFKELKILFEYDGDRILTKQTITFKANRFKVIRMYTSRTWYSDENFELVALSEGYHIEKYRQMGNETEYYIVFPKPMYFWQTKTVEIQFTGTNKRRRFENFYWYTINCPTDKLIIDVHIPSRYFSGKAKLKTFYINEQSVGNKVTDIDFDGTYSWPVPEHRVKWNCVFEWNWSEEEQRNINSQKAEMKTKKRKARKRKR